jgi:hypothetical protein
VSERLGRPLPPGSVEGLDAAVREAFRRELRPVAGIAEALETIDLPTCVASSGSQEKMRLTLGLTGLWDRFAGRIFSAVEVPRGKPAPDLFLYAAAQIGTAPERSSSRTARLASPPPGRLGCRRSATPRSLRRACEIDPLLVGSISQPVRESRAQCPPVAQGELALL